MIVEVTTFVIFFCCLWYLMSTYLQRRTLPPGPFPFPWIGNLPSVTGVKKPFSELRKKYGDIFTITVPAGTTVVLNTASLLREARITRKDDVVGKSSKFNYPFNVMTKNDVIFADFGPAYLFRRRVFMIAVHVIGSEIKQAGDDKLKTTLKNIESFDGKPFSPKELAASAILTHLWKWLTAKEVTIDDPTIKTILELHDIIVKHSWQSSLYQLIPFHSYLPTDFNRDIKQFQDKMSAIFFTEFKTHLDSYTPGIIRDLTDSFICAYRKELSKETRQDLGTMSDIHDLMFDVTFAGSETSSSSIAWFILYMVLYPDVQAKIHSELDEVVGEDRLPRWHDAPNLHYFQATLCEVLRISTPVPLSGANTIRDVNIGGYFIPKDTLVFFNFPAIHSDEREWSTPDEFVPERFLDADGKFVGWKSLHGFLPFGLGRRECTGMTFAKITMFTFLTAILHCFDLKLPEDKEKPSTESAEVALVHSPEDFCVVATKRQGRRSNVRARGGDAIVE